MRCGFRCFEAFTESEHGIRMEDYVRVRNVQVSSAQSDQAASEPREFAELEHANWAPSGGQRELHGCVGWFQIQG
jgi:hypothetical protein